MESSIVKIGNSKGVIIPKRMLTSFLRTRLVNIQPKDGGIFITPVEESTRKDWDTLFARATKKEHSESDFFNGIQNDFDTSEWTW